MRSLILAGLLWMTAIDVTHAGTETSLWHSYTPPSGETHYAFTLSKFKRGLFFGSCGPSTYSLQWSYSFDLTGAGSKFAAVQIEMRNESEIPGTTFHPDSGEITVDLKKKRVRIALKVSTDGKVVDFVGNGEYKLRTEL